ncbi:unnamed protein product, partial [Owenia fusiformis]
MDRVTCAKIKSKMTSELKRAPGHKEKQELHSIKVALLQSDVRSNMHTSMENTNRNIPRPNVNDVDTRDPTVTNDTAQNIIKPDRLRLAKDHLQLHARFHKYK